MWLSREKTSLWDLTVSKPICFLPHWYEWWWRKKYSGLITALRYVLIKIMQNNLDRSMFLLLQWWEKTVLLHSTTFCPTVWLSTAFAKWKDGIKKIIHELAHVATRVRKLKKNKKRLRGRVRLPLHCNIFWREKMISGNINILLSTRISWLGY